MDHFKNKFILLTLLLFALGSSGCHHALDFFKLRTERLDVQDHGVVFYDWWRAEPGFNLVNDPATGNCKVIHMMGFDIGSLPGQFCLFVSEDKYFSVADAPTLYGSDFKKIWQLASAGEVRDAFFDERRDWIWLLVDSSGVAAEQVIAVAASDGKKTFSWSTPNMTHWLHLRWQSPEQNVVVVSDTSSSVGIEVATQKIVIQEALKGPTPQQEFANGNRLMVEQSALEMTPEGRLVWQWNWDGARPPWINRVREDVAQKYLERLQRKTLKTYQ